VTARSRDGLPTVSCRVALIGLAVAAAAAVPARAGLQHDLEARWRGAWVVTTVETTSDCTSVYTDTDVRGELASGKGRHRFGAGELARVDKLGVKVDRVDLFLDLAEPIFETRTDGPFTLFEERRCRVQLKVDVPKAVVRRADPAAVGDILAQSVEVFTREDEARASPAWNQRQREALPADYPETLERYHAWKVEQERVRLTAVQGRALDELDRLERAIVDDPIYLAGFAAGIAAARDWSTGGCSTLSHHGPSSSPPAPPERHAAEHDRAAWRRGWEDGRDLAAALAVLRAASDCLAELPPP
jgi:hypothetical protein